jgi:hypothetical protein
MNSPQEGPHTLNHLTGWIDSHLMHFLPSGAGGLFERFKAAGELALVLFALTSPAQWEVADGMAHWAEALAQSFSNHLVLAAEQIDWYAVDLPQPSSATSVALLAYPVLEQSCGVCFAWSRQIDQQLKHMPVRPHLEWYFLRSLRFGDNYDMLLRERLAQTLKDTARTGAWTCSTLYDLTHLVFFLTHFGRRSSDVLQDLQVPLAGLLPRLIRWRLELRDYDLGAELLLCSCYTSVVCDPIFHYASAVLRAAVEPDGAVVGYPPYLPNGCNRFNQCYHTTLVCVAALAVAQRMHQNGECGLGEHSSC